MEAFIAPPQRIPFYLRAGIWLAEKMAKRELLPPKLLAWYPPVAFSSGVLEALIARVGADRIVFGTDYPFGEQDPVGNIRKTKGLAESDFEGIAGRTAAGILGRPGMVMMSPHTMTTNSAPAARRTSRMLIT